MSRVSFLCAAVKGFARETDINKKGKRKRRKTELWEGQREREKIMRVEEPRDPEKPEGWGRFKVSAGAGSRYVKQMADGWQEGYVVFRICHRDPPVPPPPLASSNARTCMREADGGSRTCATMRPLSTTCSKKRRTSGWPACVNADTWTAAGV